MKAILRILSIQLVLAAQLLHAQPLNHPWHVVDNGGGSSSAGGLSLRSSMGQSSAAVTVSGGITLEGGYIPGIRSLGGTTSVLDLPLETGWNLISVPFFVSDYRKVVLFPTGTNGAFSYNGSYAVKDTMQNGYGYWIKFPGAATNHFTGTTLSRETVLVNNNWNLIGGLSYPTLVSDMTALDTTILGSHCFGFSGGSGYYVEDTLSPGKGYWIKIRNAGRIVLKSGSAAMAPSIASDKEKVRRVQDASTAEKQSGTLTISDAKGNERKLYIATKKPEDELARYEMPPIAFEGMMDARFSSNRMLESDDAARAKEVGIAIAAAEYPVRIAWSVGDDIKGAKIRVDGKEIALTKAGETRLTNPDAQLSLSFAPSAETDLPKQFALYQNYPNPFNPTTTIRYDLPKDSHVNLKIYDALGQEVVELISADQDAGYQALVWEGTNARGRSVASGMYFYRIEARPSGAGGTFTEVRKMLIVR